MLTTSSCSKLLFKEKNCEKQWWFETWWTFCKTLVWLHVWGFWWVHDFCAHVEHFFHLLHKRFGRQALGDGNFDNSLDCLGCHQRPADGRIDGQSLCQEQKQAWQVQTVAVACNALVGCERNCAVDRSHLYGRHSTACGIVFLQNFVRRRLHDVQHSNGLVAFGNVYKRHRACVPFLVSWRGIYVWQHDSGHGWPCSHRHVWRHSFHRLHDCWLRLCGCGVRVVFVALRNDGRTPSCFGKNQPRRRQTDGHFASFQQEPCFRGIVHSRRLHLCYAVPHGKHQHVHVLCRVRRRHLQNHCFGAVHAVHGRFHDCRALHLQKIWIGKSHSLLFASWWSNLRAVVCLALGTAHWPACSRRAVGYWHGVCNGFHPNAMGLVGEAIDYNEYLTGKRTEGSIYGVFNLARRVGQTIGLGFSFFALEWINYDPELPTQTDGTVFGFKILCVL
ncbi:MAG: MFS transporter, partial [Clostridia bacterium]|nr:MFS transporter [Clostridia bacterium]